MLSEDRLLSWSNSDKDSTLILWDKQTGKCLAAASEERAVTLHPDWVHARAKAKDPDDDYFHTLSFEPNKHSVAGDFFISASNHGTRSRSAHLCHKTTNSSLGTWHGESNAAARCLQQDGTAVITQDNGQVCILKLYHGNRRVSLVEVEEILFAQKKAAK